MTDEVPSTALATRPERQRVQSIQPLFDTDHFEHFQRAASALMNSTLLKPSIRGATPQQCFSNLMLIFDQADRLGLPATVVAQNVDVVYDQIVYRGVLVAAIIESKLGKLHRHYIGDRGADAYRVYVSDRTFDDMTDEQLAALRPAKYPRGWRIVDGSVAEWRTYKKDGTPNPAWVGQSQQNQLGYRGDREWARHYEPGLLLGIFSDDEVQAYDERTVVSSYTIQPDAPVKSIITAEFAKAAEEPQGAPQAPSVAQGPDDAASGGEGEGARPQATDDSKPAQSRRRAAAKPAAAAAKDETALAGDVVEGDTVDAETCEVVDLAGEKAAEADGYMIGFRGEPCTSPLGLAPELAGVWRSAWMQGEAARKARDKEQLAANAQAAPTAKAASPPQDEAGSIDTGDRNGNALEAFEQGHIAGLAGKPGNAPQAWENFADDWSEGWNSGAAERLQDAADTGDNADVDDTDQPDDANVVVDAFDAFNIAVRGLQSWGDVKAALNVCAASPEWKADAAAQIPFRMRSARIGAWLRVVELMKSGSEAVDYTADLSAFRCWVETIEDAAMILEKWPVLVESPAFKALGDAQRASFEGVIKAVVARLQSAGADSALS